LLKVEGDNELNVPNIGWTIRSIMHMITREFKRTCPWYRFQRLVMKKAQAIAILKHDGLYAMTSFHRKPPLVSKLFI
jgi:hypothetical protein